MELKATLEEAAKRIQTVETGITPQAATPHLELPSSPSEPAVGLSAPPPDETVRSAGKVAVKGLSPPEAQFSRSLGEDYIVRARQAARVAAEPERSRFVKYPTGYPGAEDQLRPQAGEDKKPRPIA